jgi:hypothetical protein
MPQFGGLSSTCCIVGRPVSDSRSSRRYIQVPPGNTAKYLALLRSAGEFISWKEPSALPARGTLRARFFAYDRYR